MSIEELFLRQIDSVDGDLEIVVLQGATETHISTGPFDLRIDHADLDEVIAVIAQTMTDPDKLRPPLPLVDGESLSVSALAHSAENKHVYMGAGPFFLRLHFSTTCLLVAALCESRAWTRTNALRASRGVASC